MDILELLRRHCPLVITWHNVRRTTRPERVLCLSFYKFLINGIRNVQTSRYFVVVWGYRVPIFESCSDSPFSSHFQYFASLYNIFFPFLIHSLEFPIANQSLEIMIFSLNITIQTSVFSFLSFWYWCVILFFKFVAYLQRKLLYYLHLILLSFNI